MAFEPYTGDRWFDDFGIQGVPRGGAEEHDTTCPKCSGQRRKKNARCLSVNTVFGVWSCHHCGWSGNLRDGETTASVAGTPDRPRNYRRPEPGRDYANDDAFASAMNSWFEKRGVPSHVVERNRITVATSWDPENEERAPTLQFPYLRDGEVVNVKYRRVSTKSFWMVAGAERVLYGLDDLDDKAEAIIFVEGELDKLALEAAGILPVVSCPDGAPPPDSKNYSSKFSFLADPVFERKLTPKTKIYLAVDSDEPGRRLAAEIVRLLGPERCYQVSWPDGCKDANDVLLAHGAAELAKIVRSARPWPVAGAIEPSDILDRVRHIYTHGLPPGRRLGWALDDYYRPLEGTYTIVSGTPYSGTSQFLNNVGVRLALCHDWRIGMCSPEYQPFELLLADLASCALGKPFTTGPTDRMTLEEMEQTQRWVDDHFTIINPKPLTIQNLLEVAHVVVRRKGLRGLMIDPWTELEHKRPSGVLMTDYIQQVNSQFRDFARDHGIHLWMRIHPTKMQKSEDGEYLEVDPYDMAGSAHWYGQADNIVVVKRYMKDETKPTELVVKKVRFRSTGRPGRVQVRYDVATGQFVDVVENGWATGSNGEYVDTPNGPVDSDFVDPIP